MEDFYRDTFFLPLKSIASSQKCLVPLQRCLHSLQKCLVPLQRCLHSLQKCLVPLQRCLHSLQRCLLLPRDACFFPEMIASSQKCFLTLQKCLLPLQKFLCYLWKCLAPLQRCLHSLPRKKGCQNVLSICRLTNKDNEQYMRQHIVATSMNTYPCVTMLQISFVIM
jgi:hypothetical protein